MWRHGIYEPQTLVDAVSLVGDMFAVFCHYGIPVIRMGLQPTEELNFDSNFLLDGPFHPSFGYLVKILSQKGTKWKCCWNVIKVTRAFLASL